MSGQRVLVIGAGRGGTSLLTGLLDQHSQVTMGFEFAARGYLVDPVTESLEERLIGLRSACDQRAARFETPIWGNKWTTGQIAYLYAGAPSLDLDDLNDHVLDRFFNVHFAEWPVVFVLRDGSACIDSKRRRDGLDEIEAANRWLFSVRCVRYLDARRQPLHVVRFEQLVRHPEPTLIRVCEFLGIDYEPGMLGGTTNTKMRPEYQQEGFDLRATQPVEVSPWLREHIGRAMRLTGYWPEVDVRGSNEMT